MTYHNPLPISTEEWAELAVQPVVRDNWYLDDTDNGDSLAAQVYGVKFAYQYETSPHLLTDLYVLIAWMGAGSNGDAKNVVVMLCRDIEGDGHLEPLALPFPESMR